LFLLIISYRLLCDRFTIGAGRNSAEAEGKTRAGSARLDLAEAEHCHSLSQLQRGERLEATHYAHQDAGVDEVYNIKPVAAGREESI